VLGRKIPWKIDEARLLEILEERGFLNGSIRGMLLH
jgi:hypothetical protein